MDAVVFDHVGFSFTEGQPVLRDLSFRIEKGSFTVILGRNGSGKSTAARMMNCLLVPKTGKVTVLGMDTAEKANQFSIRRSAGMVFQNPDNQTVATMVEDDVAFGPENIGVPREEIGKRIDFALGAVGMQGEKNATVSRLSGGQKQRVAIAGVLALKPEILILDESTAMLDPKGRKEVLSVVKELNGQGMTVVLITHYMEEALLADEVLVMGGGTLEFSGTPKEVFRDKTRLRELGLTLPRAVDYAQKLQAAGVPIDAENILTKEELAEALCNYVRNN